MSKLFKLNKSDTIKGILIAVLSAVFTALIQMVNTVPITIDWNEILGVALTALLAYLSKNFLSNSKGKFMGTEDIGGGGIQNPPKPTKP